jgi:phosphoenolpyruvate carboxykinase (GTP)
MTKSKKLGTLKITNKHLLAFVDEVTKLTHPDRVWWCDGSELEKEALTAEACARGILIKLNQHKWPGCYYHRSNPNDVARVEQCTFICTSNEDDAGPTNNWMAPKDMYAKLHGLLKGCMKGRTMYVVPYLMGPPGSPLTKVGIEITDSIYVVLSMRVMTRMGEVALRQLKEGNDFNRGIHSMLDVNPERRYIAHFPEDNTIISVGSNYGGSSGRNASPSASARGWPARRAGWPNTCSSLALNPRRAKKPTSPPPSPAPAARPTSP